MIALVPFWTSLLLSASMGRQQDAVSPPTAAVAAVAESRDGHRTLSHLPANLGRAVAGLVSRDEVPALVTGGAASALGSRFDDDARRRVADPHNGFGRAFESIGGDFWSPVAITGLFLVSRTSDSSRFRNVSYDLVEGYLLNGALTLGLKHTVRRERPDGSNRVSFPSGHTSNAFVLATIAERHHGWKAGLPAYAFATAMGFSRMQRDKHYLSDVLAGATLGYAVGRSVVRVNGQPLAGPRTPQVSVSPILGPRTRALALTVRF